MFYLYKKENCIWCKKAEELLQEKNLPYTSYMLNVDYTKEELKLKVDKVPLTVPQIWNDDKYIGGCTELMEYLK